MIVLFLKKLKMLTRLARKTVMNVKGLKALSYNRHFSCEKQSFEMVRPEIAEDFLQKNRCVIWTDLDCMTPDDFEEETLVLNIDGSSSYTDKFEHGHYHSFPVFRLYHVISDGIWNLSKDESGRFQVVICGESKTWEYDRHAEIGMEPRGIQEISTYKFDVEKLNKYWRALDPKNFKVHEKYLDNK